MEGRESQSNCETHNEIMGGKATAGTEDRKYSSPGTRRGWERLYKEGVTF